MAQQLPEWNNPGVEPPQSLKDSGWAAGVKPSAQHFNWLLNRNFEVMKELQDIGSQATIDFKTDYNYQLGNVVGRQLRLTRISDVTRIPFLLESELVEGAAITISLDGGNTYLPLRDIEGNDVTTLPKGFGEVVASGNFFTLVNKGGSLTTQQLQALIDIVNEMTANDNDLRQSFISSVIATDTNIPLNTNSTWNQILTQIPNIKANNKKWASGVAIPNTERIEYPAGNTTGNYTQSQVIVNNLDFKPSMIVLFSRDNGSYFGIYNEIPFRVYNDVNHNAITGNYTASNNATRTGYGYALDDRHVYFGGFNFPTFSSSEVYWYAFE